MSMLESEYEFYVKINYISPLGNDKEEVSGRMSHSQACIAAQEIERMRVTRKATWIQEVTVIKLRKGI